MKLRSILVDDELSARKSLAAFIKDYCPDVEVIGEAEDIDKARELIDRLSPDLVFLDIEMPGGNAFDLLERFSAIDFDIVFITAFSDYAVRAFEMSASHYLLKPISIEALTIAVDKVVTHRTNSYELERSRILLGNINNTEAQLQKIVLPLMDGFELVRLNEILYLAALDNFTQVHLANNRRITVCRKLKYFEDLLAQSGFFRIHRSHMVNKEYIQRYHKGKGGCVILTNGVELDVAQSRKKEFLETFGL